MVQPGKEDATGANNNFRQEGLIESALASLLRFTHHLFSGKLEHILMSTEEGRSRTFPALKQYCLELLELLQNPNGYSKSLSHLHDFLRQSPHAALQPFFDYTLFPLLLLLDAAISCRSQSHVESEEISAETSALKMPHKVSDIVAEGVLQCLEELLKKCCVGSVDQFVVLLKKLTYGALLSPSEAAEEFVGE